MQLFAFVMFAQTLESPKTKVVTMDPAPGHYDVLPDGIVLTFSDKIEILESGILRTDATDAKGYMLADADYTITDNTLTLTLPKEYLAYNAQAMLKLQIKDVNGQYVTYGDSEEYITIEYTAPVRSNIFVCTAITPEDGSEVAELNKFTLTFTNPKNSLDYVGGVDATQSVVLKDLTNNVVATGTVVVDTENNASTIVITLDRAISEAGTYTLVVPEATVINSNYNPACDGLGIEFGAIYNPEFTATFTIVVTDGIESVIGNATTVKVYGIKGHLVGNSVKNLKRGIYIINGKKVLVK